MADLAFDLFHRGYRALPAVWDSEPVDSSYALRRLLGRPAHVVRGEEGARLFYDQTVVERRGIVPAPLANVLFGKGAVHGLDGERHRERKELFLQVLTADAVECLGEAVDDLLAERMNTWQRRTPINAFEELVEIYGTAAFPWAGVRIEPREADVVARRLAAIVDGFGFAPVAYGRACHARWWANRWGRQLVRSARRGGPPPPADTMLEALVTGPGADLPLDVAAVELLNVLRPTVAVAWLAVFAVQELARSPEHGSVLAQPDQRAARWHFADEIRRTTPFVPALAGRIGRAVTFEGHPMAPGDTLVLDVPGTNHRGWEDPWCFRPGRFAERSPNAFQHIPQGGGDPQDGHRCPGEPIAMTLLDRTLQRLAATTFTISAGPVDLTRIPTQPAGPLLITDIDTAHLSA
jgi:fatty-acid peroxygenase